MPIILKKKDIIETYRLTLRHGWMYNDYKLNPHLIALIVALCIFL